MSSESLYARLQEYCEENKINLPLENCLNSRTKVEVGCQICSEVFYCHVGWLFKQEDPKCQKCRRKCEHGRQKYRCAKCDGTSICEHGRRKHICVKCKGTSICKHDRRRSRCRLCNGSRICEHGREKNRCRPCNGSSICEHGRHKSICLPCGGSRICQHGIQKHRCRQCDGTSICEHDKLRNACRPCNGSSICEHGRHKSSCRQCNGSSICEHDRRKNTCKDCNGASICEHGKIKGACKECGSGSYLCKTQSCTTYASNKRYKGYCLRCFMYHYPEVPVVRNYKTKEKAVVDKVMEKFSDMSWVWDKRIQDGCSRRRPDLLVDLGTHILIIEVDEQAHSEYNCSCEAIRLQQISQDVGYRPIIMIRFNPDEYETFEGEQVKSCWTTNKLGICVVSKKKQAEWDNRLNALLQLTDYWIRNVPSETFELGEGQEVTLDIVELFFG